MPRGVYVRKPRAAKKTAKRVPATTRRRKVTVDIPTISRSSLQSSVSQTRTEDTPETLRTEVAPVVAETVRTTRIEGVDRPYAVFHSDGDTIDWGSFADDAGDFEGAEAVAKDCAEGDPDYDTIYIVQIVGIVGRSKEVVTRRIAPLL